jgi:hypothetical protein
MPEKDTKWQEWTTGVLEQLLDLNARYESLSREIAAKYESLNEELDEKNELLNTKIDRIGQIVTGDADPSKGLVIRVDRLEQNESRRAWWVKSTIAAAIGAIVTAVFALFKRP